ncbi:hypothetical protein TNCV_3809621 [Trichonephila clavipes]|nr:hypothetical protein TNCV_3809621 [Trichonephila clavipes]
MINPVKCDMFSAEYRASTPETRAGQDRLSFFIPSAGPQMRTKIAWELNTGASLQGNHLVGASAHAPQLPMASYTEINTVGLGPHRLLRD